MSADTELWTVLAPVREDRDRMGRILDRLDQTEDLVERADLASELVRAASRYEDTLERSVEPDMDLQDDWARDRDDLRRVMTVIHQRTMHVDPRNVYAPDPQGFEDALEEVADRLRARLADEDRQLAAFIGGLSAAQRKQLAGKVATAARHASERPRPPRTAVGRMVANAHVKLDHTLEDVSHPQHPGAGTVKG
ncbi:MAG TPA: hypothetical protein VHB02_15210 [Acidimicrobiales bacterium]|nr:hypothetical protein [Acidimicrobiales bacterium]